MTKNQEGLEKLLEIYFKGLVEAVGAKLTRRGTHVGCISGPRP